MELFRDGSSDDSDRKSNDNQVILLLRSIFYRARVGKR